MKGMSSNLLACLTKFLFEKDHGPIVQRLANFNRGLSNFFFNEKVYGSYNQNTDFSWKTQLTSISVRLETIIWVKTNNSGLVWAQNMSKFYHMKSRLVSVISESIYSRPQQVISFAADEIINSI